MSANAGQSLIQVIMAMAIFGVFMVGNLSMQQNQLRENRALAEQLGAFSLEKDLIVSLADGSVCNFLMTDASQVANRSGNMIDSTDATTLAASAITFNNILTRANAAAAKVAVQNNQASVMSSSLKVASIRLTNFQGGGPDYTGHLVLTFNSPPALIRNLKPLDFPITVSTTGVGPTTQITGCLGNGAPLPSTVDKIIWF